MKNKPLSAYKKKKLIESFCDELTATQAAHRLNLDRNTVNKYFKRIRECIAGYREYQKMRLLISFMTKPGQKAEVVTKQIPSQSHEGGIPVHLMCIAGQLLTDIDSHSTANVPSYIMKVSDYLKVHLNGSDIHNSPVELRKDELERIAEDFNSFAAQRFKKYFGIRGDHAYLYLKEAEFVFNEKDPKTREHFLNKMMDHIFS